MARTDDHSADDDKLRLMLQTLLADRFGLRVHREQKEQQVYSLTVARNGPKLRESHTEGQSRFREDKGGAIGEHVSMEETADKISELLDRRVINRTGLKGRYDFRVDVTPYMTGAEGKPDIMSILFAGFNEQLGLKLEPGKEIVELLVIDSVNKTPTEN